MPTLRELPPRRASIDTRPHRRNRTFNAAGDLICWLGVFLAFGVFGVALVRMLGGGR